MLSARRRRRSFRGPLPWLTPQDSAKAGALSALSKCHSGAVYEGVARLNGFRLIHPLYSLSGLAVGLLVGVTGVGGGSLMTPLLVLAFGIRPTTAVGTGSTLRVYHEKCGHGGTRL